MLSVVQFVEWTTKQRKTYRKPESKIYQKQKVQKSMRKSGKQNELQQPQTDVSGKLFKKL